MARTRISPITAEDILMGNTENDEPAEETLPDDEDLLSTPDEVAIETMVNNRFKESREDSSIRIFRRADSGKGMTYIDDIPASQFNLKMLKFAPFNGGRLLLRGYLKGRLVINESIDVEPGPLEQKVESLSGQVQLSPVLEAIQKQGEQMQAIILALANRPEPVKESRVDFFKELAMMKSLFAQPEVHRDEKDPLDQLKRILEIQQMVAPKGDGEGGGMLGMVGGKLIDLMSDMAKNNALQQSSQIVNPQLNPPSQQMSEITQYGNQQPGEPSKSIPQTESEEVMQAKMALDLLVGAAQSKADTDTWAGLIYDNAPDDVFEMLTNDPRWYAKLCAGDNRFDHHAEWLSIVHSKIIALYNENLTPEPAESTNPETEPGIDNATEPPTRQ